MYNSIANFSFEINEAEHLEMIVMLELHLTSNFELVTSSKTVTHRGDKKNDTTKFVKVNIVLVWILLADFVA